MTAFLCEKAQERFFLRYLRSIFLITIIMIYTRSEFISQTGNFSPFAQQVVQNFCENISKNDFPCYFAKNVINKDSVYFSFIENDDNQLIMFEKAAQDFKNYAQIERNPDPYRVLLMNFELKTVNWEADDAFLWAFLAYLHKQDPEPWPADIPKNPNEQGWSFCFMGMPWFFNVNSPHHAQNRPSRNTTDALTWVIQRTDSFAPLAPVEMHATIIESVRSRIAPYDGQSTSPALAGESDNLEELEWIQYHLPNFNHEKPKKTCPFSTTKG